MKTTRHTLACLIAIAIVGGATTGCASWKSSSSGKSWNPKTWFKKEYQEPVSMATIWRADRMAEPGQREMRGFGARIYFYNEKSQAIPVDGDVVVHGYITTPSSQRVANDQPDRKFTYTSEQLASQYSPSDMGASYSIWVPWDEDGFREEVTLFVTFKSKKGGVVQASPTKVFLPGKSRLSDEQIPPVTQQVSYKKSKTPTYDVGPEPEKLPSTRVTTIDLPQKSRLIQSNIQSPAIQNSFINTLGEGTSVEVGGRGNNAALNQVQPGLENLPPPPQGMPQPNLQPFGFQQPAVGRASYNQAGNSQTIGTESLTQVGLTTLSPSDSGQQGWGKPGWGQSRFSQAQSARTNLQLGIAGQPSQPENPSSW